MARDGRQALGISGENLACAELQRRGYAILERRYRTRLGEIDIIARDGATLVFVEVKARLTDDFGGAAAAVTAWKQRRIAHMAMDYLARRTQVDCPCRFDVVAIDVDAAGPRIIVYPNAFDSPF
jgi:putative endonuclease